MWEKDEENVNFFFFFLSIGGRKKIQTTWLRKQEVIDQFIHMQDGRIFKLINRWACQ